MRVRLYWDKQTKDWVQAKPRSAAGNNGPMVVGDIQPYRSMRTGEVITGRRQHRDHLKAHGLVELGNDMPLDRAPSETPRERVDSIRRAMSEVQQGRRIEIDRYGSKPWEN